MAPADPNGATPIGLVELTAKYFADKGIESPRLDAEVLLAHILGVTRIGLYLQFDKPLEKPEIDGYRELVRRRAGGEPTAYILGAKEFWSLEFQVGPGVLTPRPDTELLVETALEECGEQCRFAELGTGSGAVSAALLTSRPEWTGVGVELEDEAAGYTRRNIAAHGVGERFDLRMGDLLEPLGEERFGMILSNPPYIPSGDIAGLMDEVSKFEPAAALDGGPDGLDVIRRLIADAPANLVPGGLLLVEFGMGQGTAVAGLIAADDNYDTPRLAQDLGERERVVITRTVKP